MYHIDVRSPTSNVLAKINIIIQQIEEAQVQGPIVKLIL